MLHETIRNDDFKLNKALQHCFEWLQHCCNIAALCYTKNGRCESSRVTSPQTGLHSFSWGNLSCSFVCVCVCVCIVVLLGVVSLRLRLCSYDTEYFSCWHEKLSSIVWTPIRYVTLHFRDPRSAASFHHRKHAKITVLMCEQKPYPV